MTVQAIEIETISVNDVAETLGTTPLNVLLFIKRGQLKGVEIEGAWFVDRVSLAVFRENMAGQAGPAPCRSACHKAGGCGSCN